MPLSGARRRRYQGGNTSFNGTLGPWAHSRASTTLTIDSNGYYQQVASGVAAYDTNGLRVTPQLVNKCQGYGLIPDDQEQSPRTSGTMTVGKVYKIKVQTTTTDFVADGAPNPHAVGDTFGCTAATVTLTAGKSVAEMKWAVGTKSLYSGGTWNQNIDGIVVDTAAPTTFSVSIVDDSANLDSGTYKISQILPNGKVLKYDNSGSASFAGCYFSGTSGNTNSHSLQVVCRVGSGTLRLSWFQSSTGSVTTTSTIYVRIAANNLTPGASYWNVQIRTEAYSVSYILLPGLYERTVAPLYPVVANSTSASTTQAQTTASIPLAPNFRQDSFMVTCEVALDFALTNLTNSTSVAIATLNSGTAASLLYFVKDGSGNGYLTATDGTNTATVAWTPVAGTAVKIGVRGNTALNELQVSLNGINGTATSYDGGIAVDGQNKIYLQGINNGFSIKNVKNSPDRGAAALAAATA